MPTTYLFVDEAGRSRIKGALGDQPYFIVGVLLTNNPNALREAVARARAIHSFPNEIHWTKQSALRIRVYREVVAQIRKLPDWEYKDTCVPVKGFDLSYYGGREDLAYNRMVRHGIDAALRFPKITIHRELDITIDAKQRLGVDNCLQYIRERYAEMELEERDGEAFVTWRPVAVRELDSKLDDLIQVCDLISGARNSVLAKACGPRKLALAPQMWIPDRCREFMSTKLGGK